MVEEWRPVWGYDGRYEVSNRGRVRSLYKKKTWRREPKILKPSTYGGGYKRVILSLNGSQDTRLVHKLVMDAFVGRPPEGYVTRHLDGDPSNNWLDNLRYGTPVENSADRRVHGTHHQGELVNGAKLTEWHVREIRRLREEGWKQRAIANLFGVPRTTINSIVNGYSWRHVA